MAKTSQHRREQRARAAQRHAQPPAAATPTTVASRYRCAVHVDEQVTWQGKGCDACAEHRALPRARHSRQPLGKRSGWVGGRVVDGETEPL